MTTTAFYPGAAIKLYGSKLATVLSVHRNGKTLGVLFPDGKTTFVKSSAAAVV